MSARQRVLDRYPQAICRRECNYPFSPTFTVLVDTGVWGHGITERDAWRDAARTINEREGRNS